MGKTLPNWRIFSAILFSGALIVGAYLLASGSFATPLANASTETAILKAIATKDSDNDGLPDWEEALYGTDPYKSDTRGLGMTDGEAVAKGLIVPKAAEFSQQTGSSTPDQLVDGIAPPTEGSLTDAFAKNFFSLYLTAKQQKNGDLSEQEMSDLAQKSMSDVIAAVKPAPNFKTAADLTVTGSGPEALRTFAASAEAIFTAVKNDSAKSEVLYLQDIVENHDATAAGHILSIAKSYRDAAVGLAKLPVPKELATTDLNLINALMRISQVATDFAGVDQDPLTTIFALQQYPQAVLNLGGSFIDIYTVYKNAGVTLPAGTPGAGFVNLIQNVAAKQQAATTQP